MPLPTLDITQLQEITGNEKEINLELLDLYIEHLRSGLREMETQLSSQNHPKARQEAHLFKGSSSNVGALRLQHCLQQLERKLTEDDLKGARGSLERCKVEFADFVEAVEAYRQED